MAWELLFKSDAGVASLLVILFMICMAVFIFAFVRRKMREDEHDQRLKR
jgi:predicted permease